MGIASGPAAFVAKSVAKRPTDARVSAGGGGGGPSYDADAADYFTRAEGLGGSFDLSAINGTYTESYVKTAISDFVGGCKSDAIWTKLTEVYLLSGVTFGGVLAKLKHAGTATLTNVNFVSGDYVAAGSGAGLKGGGGNKRLETGVIPSVFMSASSGSLGIYAEDMETAGTVGFIKVADAALGSAPHVAIISDSGNRRGAIAHSWSGPEMRVAAASAVAAAFEVVSRTSTTDCRFYRNGSQSGSTQTNFASGVAAGSIGLFSLRYGTGTGTYSNTNFSNMRAKLGFAGTGLNDTEAANLSSRVNALMTAIGANVY